MFGTDGIRGRANRGLLRPESVLRIGRAIGHWLHDAPVPHRALIARDPRRSGDLLDAALSAGLLSEGIEVVDVGMLPTPAAMFLTGTLEAGIGVMLSASHNPAPDNGLKLFTPCGNKLSDADQAKIEALAEGDAGAGVDAPELGLRRSEPEALASYLNALCERYRALQLAGQRIWIDCAHGATSVTAAEVLRRLGAEVIGFADTPQPDLINRGCGATAPAALAERVGPGELGLCFDGDGDRVMLIDEQGAVRDGDDVLFVIASHRRRRGSLAGGRVVGTVMTNFGLEHALAGAGIELLRVPVGDRAIAACLASEQLSLGGEPSGHIIFPEFLAAGDGLQTSLELLAVLQERESTLAALAGGWQRSPQVLINVPVGSQPDLAGIPAVCSVESEVRTELEGRGRLVLRYSGTEPLCRVMVEADCPELARSQGERMAACLRENL